MGGAVMERSWKWRRIAVFTSLAVCDFVIVYIAIFGADTRLSETLVNGAWLAMAGLANGYIFGGAWDDKNRDAAMKDAGQ